MTLVLRLRIAFLRSAPDFCEEAMGPWRIPSGYEELVRVYLRANGGDEKLGIGAGDFPDQSILIRFADGSFAHFQSAFMVQNSTQDEVAVFTEHCGYHVFSLTGATLAVLKPTAQLGSIDS